MDRAAVPEAAMDLDHHSGAREHDVVSSPIVEDLQLHAETEAPTVKLSTQRELRSSVPLTLPLEPGADLVRKRHRSIGHSSDRSYSARCARRVTLDQYSGLVGPS